MAGKRGFSGIVPDFVIALRYVPGGQKALGFQKIARKMRPAAGAFSTARAK
jgi:hypothetical protein